MGIYDAIGKLIDISEEKLNALKDLEAVCESITLCLAKEDYESVDLHNNNRFDIEIQINGLDTEFYNVIIWLNNEGIDNFDKIDSMVYPNIKKLKKIVANILNYEEKLSIIKLKNNQLMSESTRDNTKAYHKKAIGAYKKQKLNK